MATSDQLQRLLYVLPAAARPNGARLDDLARALGVAPSAILADIEQATARAFYHPAGSVDAFNILVDGEYVRVEASREFQRPARLNLREAMALDLGLRVLAAESDAARREEILAFAERLRTELAVPEVEMHVIREMGADLAPSMLPALQLAVGEDDFRGVLTDAIEDGRVCEVSYLKPLGTQPEDRRIAPQRLIYAHGHWYVAAVDVDVAEQRVFRLDRMLSVHLTRATYHALAPVEQRGAYAEGEREKDVMVRYSPRIARWVAEHRDVAKEQDGSVVITHRVSDPQWLVRHVLQYGGEAVVETAEMRPLLAAAAARLSA
jgi:predicted DNA-binding transcriptional regulator YafY